MGCRAWHSMHETDPNHCSVGSACVVNGWMDERVGKWVGKWFEKWVQKRVGIDMLRPPACMCWRWQRTYALAACMCWWRQRTCALAACMCWRWQKAFALAAHAWAYPAVHSRRRRRRRGSCGAHAAAVVNSLRTRGSALQRRCARCRSCAGSHVHGT
eukprot:365268-Chlamydomonas_euryale.AAC.4